MTLYFCEHSTVEATGIAALTRAQIACNMADFHEKSTQKNTCKFLHELLHTDFLHANLKLVFLR